MSYKKRDNFNTGIPGETVIELEDGSLVAVSCEGERCGISQNHVFVLRGRWIDDHGQTLKDKQNKDVTTEYRHSAQAAYVKVYGIDRLRRACLKAVIGEDMETVEVTDSEKGTKEQVPIIQFSSDVLHSMSIKNAVIAAKRTFETVNAGDLL
jgi:hypothetical protein